MWTIFLIILHALSIGFALLVLYRLFLYIRRYRFSESKYTLLFGFVHLRWIAVAYIVLLILWIPASFLLLPGL